MVHELQFILARGQRIETELINDPKAHINSDQEKIQRFIAISKKAVDILEFLQDAFGKSHRHGIKSVTSKGSILDRIDFQEDFYNPVNIILFYVCL